MEQFNPQHSSAQFNNAYQPSLSHRLNRYFRFWPLFLISLLVAFLFAFLYIKYSTPLYVINSTILIHDDKGENRQPKNEQFVDPNTLADNKNIENEILILRSSSVMRRVIEELHLDVSYYIPQSFRNAEIYSKDIPISVKIITAKKNASKKEISIKINNNSNFSLQEKDDAVTIYKFGEIIIKSYATFIVNKSSNSEKLVLGESILLKLNDLNKLTSSYSQKLSISTANKQASILNIGFIDALPERGEDVVNKLIDVYNKQASEDKNIAAEKNINFINQRLSSLSNELSNVEKGVEKFKQKNRVADITSQINQSLDDVSEYNKQISNYNIQISNLESIEKYVTQPNKMIPGTLDIQDPVLSNLISKYNDLQLNREVMLRTAQEGNPIVQSMNEQISNLQLNIQENIRNIKDNFTKTRNRLMSKADQYGSKVLEVPTIERGLQKINRQESIKRELYLYLLQKREEANLMLAATIKNAQIIDTATSSEFPVSPQKLAIYAIALMFGLGLPFGFLYLRESTNSSIQSIKDIEWINNIQILGEIPYRKISDPLVVTEKSKSTITEVFKLIRSNIQFIFAHETNKIILVTSSMSGEGKSFISLNLSASLAIANKKTVLINFDLRKNSSTFPNNDEGLSSYLQSDTIHVESIIQQSNEIKNLYFINSGGLPQNPSELMLKSKVDDLFIYLKNNFEYIIIDSSPVGQVADAFALNNNINATIYVVRYEKTQKGQLNIIDKIKNENKLKNISLIVNGAKINDSYGYGYGYGYGYSEDKQKTI